MEEGKVGIHQDRLLVCDWVVLVKSEIFKYIHAPRAPKTSILMGPFEALGCDFTISLDAVAESESMSRRGTL